MALSTDAALKSAATNTRFEQRVGPAKERRLDSGEEGAVGGDEAVGHARGVEGPARVAVAVEEDEAAGGAGAFGEEMDGFAGDQVGGGGFAGNVEGRVHAGGGATEKIDG